jgi:2-aminoethylphosphonate-pyruvate transaminase
MNEMDRDQILLTPGPLTTTLRTKLAMLRDWGSWDADEVRASLQYAGYRK